MIKDKNNWDYSSNIFVIFSVYLYKGVLYLLSYCRFFEMCKGIFILSIDRGLGWLKLFFGFFFSGYLVRNLSIIL